MYDRLFSEIKLRGLQLNNRVVFPAMGSRFCSDDGYVYDQLIDYHVARVQGGCGLNITEAVAVWQPGATAGMLQISSDDYIPGLKKLTDAIHQAGGKACIQLWQGGLAASQTPGSIVVLPSDLKLGNFTIPGVSLDVIHECEKAFGEAAKRAVEAGFDCIEYHAAHNYSPHSFLSAGFNHRDDEYGGSLENRARYLLESIKNIRQNIPEDMPLIMRISAHDDELENGLTIEEIIEFCKMAKAAGVDVLDVSRGNMITSAMRYEVPSLDIPRSFNVDNAARIRQETGMPTIAVGRINDPKQAEQILEDDKADMVVIGRAQIADPEFCNKAKAGQDHEILRCIGCNQGCYEKCLIGQPITCLRNPSVGREAEFNALKPSASPKKVLVIGGGVGGMEAAMMAHKLGHQVILAEASNQLGGQFMLAGVAPRKEEMALATQARAKQLFATDIDIRLNTFVTTETLADIQPEYVIIANGASPIIPDIEGTDLPNVYNTVDILSKIKTVSGDTIVVGGGLVGLEVAEFIRQQGNQVTVIEMQDKIAKDVGPGRNIPIMMHVMGSGIQTIVNAKCVKITENGVTIEKDGQLSEVSGQNIVISVGSHANQHEELESWCQDHQIPVTVIGDAKSPRRALQAIHEGVEAAIHI